MAQDIRVNLTLSSKCLLWLLQACLRVIGIHDENVNLKDVKKYFKKKSIQVLPEKHPTVPNAHTKFEEVNAAFVKVLKFYRDQGESTYHLLPEKAEVFANNLQVTVSLTPDSSSAWKKAIKISYQNVIIGAQKATTSLNMKGTKGWVRKKCMPFWISWAKTNFPPTPQSAQIICLGLPKSSIKSCLSV